MYSEYKDNVQNTPGRGSDSLLAQQQQRADHPAGESTEEGGYSSNHRRNNNNNNNNNNNGKTTTTTGIQNSELHAHLVSNDDLMLTDLENGRGGGGGNNIGDGGGFLVQQSDHDPFYVVKEDVLIKLEMTDDALERYQRTVENTDTAVNTHEVKEAKKQLKRHIKNVESTLKDLDATVRLVESRRDKFLNISDAELYERKTFVCTCADRIKMLKEEMNSESIKVKLMSDERSKAKRRMGFIGTQSQEMREDEVFLEDTQASAHLMMRQQDEVLGDLDEAVERVGHMADNIHEELGQQNKTLNELEEDLEDAEEKLGLVMGKLSTMLKTKSKWQLGTIMCLSMVVVILFFLVLYT